MVMMGQAGATAGNQSRNRLQVSKLGDLIDLAAASRISGIAAVTLRAHAASGKLRAFRLGGRWVTSRRWLQEYLSQRSPYLGIRNRRRHTAVDLEPPVKLDDDLEIWVLLQQAWQTMQKARDKELARRNLTLKRSHILFLVKALSSAGVPVTVGEITRWTLLEKHSVFERIKRMEKEGLVRRVPSRVAARAMELELTEAGEQALELAGHRESISLMLSVLSPPERRQLKAICRKLRDSAVAIIDDYTKRVML